MSIISIMLKCKYCFREFNHILGTRCLSCRLTITNECYKCHNKRCYCRKTRIYKNMLSYSAYGYFVFTYMLLLGYLIGDVIRG